MITEALILAGGKGTRLRSVVQDVPKPMAPISGKPFLHYQMKYLKGLGISRFVLSVGYKQELIREEIGLEFEGVPVVYAIEEEPLGTGGGLRHALQYCQTDTPLVCNGDTFFEINLSKLFYVHRTSEALLTFSVREIDNNGRFGGLQIEEDASVSGFVAKDVLGKTFINAGTYVLHKGKFLASTEASRFSLEDDFLAKRVSQGNFVACAFRDSKFIDIGIPEDYEKAQTLIPEWASQEKRNFNTLFLDRDGVLNKKIDGSYVRKPEELEVLPGVPEKLAEWRKANKKLFVVTNQRGVGRGLMSLDDLQAVHQSLLEKLALFAVAFEDIKFCTDVEANSPRRKPNPGMLLEIFDEFPAVKKETTLFIGDSLSDLQAGNAAGVETCFISHGKSLSFEQILCSNCIFESLSEVDLTAA
ncbi:HAD-IIIA family hydrolase [Marinilongibacter aquaticus]|uniref:HAD-IIIA family hydrolase n=1 Tax=Marinilongibacter aquaticus TaxID=2975157 RepID=UPI0021BD9A91|nr:HAD-IIIA family hydrolase [Marinilongibacter aquaticus]UBM57914.1 HAD-IIIA family hydrolase [Marinilongibacter aquaticus]